jgi:sugar/nucleoside kinase (ribokinase family)
MPILFLFFLSFLLDLSHSYEILTISDSIVDHILYVDEGYLSTLPGKKGGSCLVDNTLFHKIISESRTTSQLRPGSSGVNVIKGLKQLGHDCALTTTIGKDSEGEFFLKSLHEQGIALFLQYSSLPTGKSACLVTPSGERTMRTFLGASKENVRLKLNPEIFFGISHFHIEGYQLTHRQLIKEAIALAQKNGATISLDLSSFEVVKTNQKFIWELLQNKEIDILFGNEEEAMMLTDLEAKEAAALLAQYCDISVITMGEKGCYTNKGPSQWKFPAISVEAIDTIGAGDLFISGFLHGFLTRQPIPVCASCGTLLASHVVQLVGAEIPKERWDTIKIEIAERCVRECF